MAYNGNSMFGLRNWVKRLNGAELQGVGDPESGSGTALASQSGGSGSLQPPGLHPFQAPVSLPCGKSCLANHLPRNAGRKSATDWHLP
jgi:hypothetical protein